MTPPNQSDDTTAAPGERFLRWGMIVLIVLVLVVEVLAQGPLRTSFWGFHTKAYLPWVWKLLWLLPALAALVLLKAWPKFPSWSAPARIPSRRLVMATLLGIAALLLWLFRTRHLFLGDNLPIAINLPIGDLFHPRAPLSHLVLTLWYRWFCPPAVSGADPDAVREAAVWHGVFWGLGWVLVALGLGRAVRADRKAGNGERALAGLLLVTQGSVLVFFGYLEYYAVAAVVAGAYLLAGIRYADGRGPLLLPAALLILSIGFHLSTTVLVPSFVALAILGLRDPVRRRGALRDLALAAGLVVLMDRALALLKPGFGLWEGLRRLGGVAQSDRGGGAGLDYLLSLRHVRDLINDLHLVGPMGAGLFVVVLGGWLIARRRMSARSLFALAAVVPVLGVCALTSEPILGYPRDWDIFIPVASTITVAALLLLGEMSLGGGRLRAFLVAAVLVSLAHTVGWVALNTSEARSMARVADLPLGLGRGAVMIGNWHLRHGNRGEARKWFEQALREGPANPNTHELLAVVNVQDGRIEEAVRYMEQAIALRPDKPEYRREVIDLLLKLERCADAIPHFEALARQHAADYRDHLYYGDCLQQAGRLPEALDVSQSALRLAPDSPEALLQCGDILIRLGRTDEARTLFRRYAERYPDTPQATGIREWLAEPR